MLNGREYHDKLEMSGMGRAGGSDRRYMCHIFAALGQSHFCGSHMGLVTGTIATRTSLLHITLLPHGGACLFSTRIQVSALLLICRMISGKLLHPFEPELLCQENTT